MTPLLAFLPAHLLFSPFFHSRLPLPPSLCRFFTKDSWWQTRTGRLAPYILSFLLLRGLLSSLGRFPSLAHTHVCSEERPIKIHLVFSLSPTKLSLGPLIKIEALLSQAFLPPSCVSFSLLLSASLPCFITPYHSILTSLSVSLHVRCSRRFTLLCFFTSCVQHL